MATFKLTLEYDGTGYAGWQRQPNQPTVQAAVETALRQLTHSEIAVVGAGRTDAGVHALGQVASFRSDRPLRLDEWSRGLNALLPVDISVVTVEAAADDFHARYAARGKVYHYRILNRRARSALDHQRAWHIWGALDLKAMQATAALLKGRHDFRSFQGPQSETEQTVCDLRRLVISEDPPFVTIRMEADRFLKQMIRAMVGTLVDVGLGKRPPDSMQTILDARDRRAAGQTAPSHGLYLLSVSY